MQGQRLLVVALLAVLPLTTAQSRSCVCEVQCQDDDDWFNFGDDDRDETEWQCECGRGDEAECEGSECTQAWLQRNAAACGGDETILFGQPATDGNPEIYSLFGQGCEVQCEDKTYSDSELERQKKTCKCQTDKGGSAVKSAFSVFVDRDNDDFGDDDSSDDDEYNRDDIEFECECATAKVSQCQCEGHGCSSTAFRQCLEYSSCPVELFDPQNGDVQCQTDEDYDDYYSDADDDGFYDSISDDNGFDDDGYFDQDFDDFDISDDNGFDD